MKKGLLFLLAGLMVWGFSLKALADTRVDSMSLDVREIDDIDLIWLYPNMATDYKNTVDFRLGNLNGGGVSEWGGVLADMGNDLGVWGVYVNRPTVQYNDASNLILSPAPVAGAYWAALGSYLIPFPWAPANNALDLFWANKYGDANLGVRLTYAESWISGFFAADDVEQTENWGLSLGAGVNNFIGFQQANFHLDYDFQSITSTPSINYFFGSFPYLNDNGIQSFKVGTLLESSLSANNTLRLFGDAKADQYKIEIWGGGPPEELDYNQKDIDLGAAVNQKVLDGKGLVISGLILDYYNAKENIITGGQAQDAWNILWNVAAEGEVASWLTLRTGVEFPLFSRDWGVILPFSSLPVGNNYLNDTTPGTVAFSMGAGINFQNFVLDIKVDQTSLDDSINNVHPGQGLLTAGNMFTVTEADMKYKF
jgi:hypothetical protein